MPLNNEELQNNLITSANTFPYYITSTNYDATSIGNGTMFYQYDGSMTFLGNSISLGVDFKTDNKGKISAQLYFKYLKKKMGVLEKMKLQGRLKRLEKAFDKAVDSGQEVLAKKFLDSVVISAVESELYARGIKFFLEKEEVDKYKNRIKDGHISDTMLQDYVRVIPKSVLEKKKKVEDLFHGFVIYHYYNPELEAKREKKQELSEDEKGKMRDPILFGRLKYNNRLYFIADWEDEYCDLTFDEMIGVMGCEEKDIMLTKDVKLISQTDILS